MSHGGKKKHDMWASAACFQGGAPKRSKAFKKNLTKKGVYMVGFISNLAPLLNDLLHTKSRPPPIPPDSRQAGERGAIRLYSQKRKMILYIKKKERDGTGACMARARQRWLL